MSAPEMTTFEFLGAAEPIGRAVVLTALAVLWTVFLVRIVGLRAFSKMTAFDFVTTIATGSLIAQAGTRSDWPSFVQAIAAIGGIFLIQWALATTRRRSDRFQRLIKNKPVLLMQNGSFIDSALARTRVSRSSIVEKLRASNVGSFDEVRAVVLETTGDMSVLSKGDVDERLLEDVQGYESAAPRT